MKIWFCAKTDDPLDTVAKVITAFNNVDEQTPKGKWTWSIEKGTGPEEYWKIISKFEVEKDASCVALVYREGDTVVLGEVPDEVLPNFLAPLLSKYGFDRVKWIVADPKRQLL